MTGKSRDGLPVVERLAGNLVCPGEFGLRLELLGFDLIVGMYAVNVPAGFLRMFGVMLTNGNSVVSGNIDGTFDGLLLAVGNDLLGKPILLGFRLVEGKSV